MCFGPQVSGGDDGDAVRMLEAGAQEGREKINIVAGRAGPVETLEDNFYRRVNHARDCCHDTRMLAKRFDTGRRRNRHRWGEREARRRRPGTTADVVMDVDIRAFTVLVPSFATRTFGSMIEGECMRRRLERGLTKILYQVSVISACSSIEKKMYVRSSSPNK